MNIFWNAIGIGIATLIACVGLFILAMAPEILTLIENYLAAKTAVKEENRVLAAIDECIDCEWKANGSLVDEAGNRYWIDKFGNTVYVDIDA